MNWCFKQSRWVKNILLKAQRAKWSWQEKTKRFKLSKCSDLLSSHQNMYRTQCSHFCLEEKNKTTWEPGILCMYIEYPKKNFLKGIRKSKKKPREKSWISSINNFSCYFTLPKMFCCNVKTLIICFEIKTVFQGQFISKPKYCCS